MEKILLGYGLAGGLESETISIPGSKDPSVGICDMYVHVAGHESGIAACLRVPYGMGTWNSFHNRNPQGVPKGVPLKRAPAVGIPSRRSVKSLQSPAKKCQSFMVVSRRSCTCCLRNLEATEPSADSADVPD